MNRYRADHGVTAATLIRSVFALSLLSARAYGQAPPTIEAVVAVHESYKHKLASAHAIVDEVSEPTALFYRYFHRNPPAAPERGTSHAFWAFKGKRMYTRTEYPGRVGATLAAGGSREQELIYDGDRTYSIDHYANRPGEMCADARAERLGHTARHNPLEFGYWTVHGDWIADVLREGKWVTRWAPPHPMFGPLAEIEGEERSGEVLRFWVAPKQGMLAVRSEVEDSRTHQTDRYEAAELQPRGALLVPIRGVRTLKDGEGQVISRSTYTATNLGVNDVPDSQFDFNVPPGGSFWDADSRTKFLADAHGRLVRQAINADSPPGGFLVRWMFVACTTLLSVTLVAALVRWGRRGSAA